MASALFLEDWLRTNTGSNSTSSSTRNQPSSSSARAIIQAWAELRDSVLHQAFQQHHLQSLKVLLDSRSSLHVADPQAKLIFSILSSRNINLPHESYPLLLRLLYIWVRKSFRPSPVLIDSAAEVLSYLFGTEFDSKKSPELFSEGVLLLGAFSFVPFVSETTKTICLALLCKLLHEEYVLVSPIDDLVPDVLAGIGYALCSSVNTHYGTILDSLLGIWGKENGPPGKVSYGLMILHLVEWTISGFINSHSLQKLQTFAENALEITKPNYVPFALVMASGGVLRALNRSVPSSQVMQVVSRLRISAENRMESVAEEVLLRYGKFPSSDDGFTASLLLQCISLALARGSPISTHPSLLKSLASALLMEVFPLQRLYRRILESMPGSSVGLGPSEVTEHLNSAHFREAGAITGVFCNQYVSIDEENKAIVEDMIWCFCQDLYSGHRKVALLLRGKDDELLADIEKIAESAFLMVVLFSLAVSKHKLNPKFSTAIQRETSVSILISFSCIEYFRRMRLPEYMDAIRGVVMSVQEDETACVSFVESVPPYVDLINPQECLQKMEYAWFKDEVQTARILFFMRIIPTCIERLPSTVFRRVVAPTMFLYMGHPNGKVARASHSVFVAFTSSGEDTEERSLLKEQLAFYYVQRSLTGYPGVTPFEGMASGIVALVRNLPAGSPATVYSIHSLVEKANGLCTDPSTSEEDMWKDWRDDSEPCKKVLELLLRLISLVDIQVLPSLMKLLAQLIVQLPKDGQNAVLDELYTQIAESDDVTRKPTLVSWLQSVSYLCSQSHSGGVNARL